MTEPVPPIVITSTASGLAVSGEIDAHTAPAVAAALADSHATNLRIDLSDVEFVDSSGLRVLIEAQRARRARGGSLTVVRPSRVVSRLFEIAGVNEFLNVTVDDPEGD